jgi:hypothetical protein
MACVPATCPAPGSALLIDSNEARASWTIRKMDPFAFGGGTDVDRGCGTAMPMWASPATSAYSPAESTCLESLFLTIASFGTPCTLPGQTPVTVPPPPCP